MTAPAAQSYDEVPYPSLPSPRTHPSHLGAIGRLFGLKCASIRNARLLELGCAGGGNLLPLAVNYPESRFIGIDASSRQIAEAEAAASALRLSNLRFSTTDILALPDDLGQFDYIVCHGVFSWVPRPVQDQILQVCRRHLSPQGIAFVSYNTYPGWYLRAVVRDMMRYHTRAWASPRERVAQARALLDFLVQSATGRTEAFRHVLRDEAAIVRSHADAYLFHEHLEDVNEALYFHEFMDRAKAAELQYLGDTELATMFPTEFGGEVAQLLKDAPLEVQEQYLDFLRNRSFRGTLLCHGNVQIGDKVDLPQLDVMDAALEEMCELPSSWTEREPLCLKFNGGAITAQSPVVQAALLRLVQEWPGPISVMDLAEGAIDEVRKSKESVEERQYLYRVVIQELLKLYVQRIIRLQLDAPLCSGRVSSHPCVSPLVRWQAQHTNFVTNQRHESLSLSDLSRCLLPQLDGSHDCCALQLHLKRSLARGELAVRTDRVPAGYLPDEKLLEIVNQALTCFARDALLVA